MTKPFAILSDKKLIAPKEYVVNESYYVVKVTCSECRETQHVRFAGWAAILCSACGVSLPRPTFRGYRGREAHRRAREASRTANPNPLVWALEDGSLVGVGETLLMGDDTLDRVLWGAYGRYLLESEALATGLLSAGP